MNYTTDHGKKDRKTGERWYRSRPKETHDTCQSRQHSSRSEVTPDAANSDDSVQTALAAETVVSRDV